MIKITEPKKVEVEINGETIQLIEPKFKDVVELAKIEEADAQEALKIMVNVLVSCGIPERVVEELSYSQVKELIEVINKTFLQ